MHALKGVDFGLNGGECVALLGENGAGKSTLIKVLGGAHQPDEGSLEIDGQPMVFEKPTDSLDAGIAIIYQEFNLVPGLSVAENVFWEWNRMISVGCVCPNRNVGWRIPANGLGRIFLRALSARI